MPADYQLVAGGVQKTDDKTFIPEDPDLHAWRVYLDWVDAGGSPDAETVVPLGDYKTQQKALIERAAEREYLKHVPTGVGRAFVDLLVYDEAELADADGSIAPGEYPLLEARIPRDGLDVSEVATAMLAERETRRTALAAIDAVRADTLDDIDDATTHAEVDIAVAAVSWP